MLWVVFFPNFIWMNLNFRYFNIKGSLYKQFAINCYHLVSDNRFIPDQVAFWNHIFLINGPSPTCFWHLIFFIHLKVCVISRYDVLGHGIGISQVISVDWLGRRWVGSNPNLVTKIERKICKCEFVECCHSCPIDGVSMWMFVTSDEKFLDVSASIFLF